MVQSRTAGVRLSKSVSNTSSRISLVKLHGGDRSPANTRTQFRTGHRSLAPDAGGPISTFSGASCTSQSRSLKGEVMGKLEGKVAVITGGATGIGLAAAKRFIEEGAFVFIFGRRQEALDAAVADLGPNARAVKGSVSDEADLDRLYAAVKAERGTLDIVFANAGAGSPLAHWRR